MKQVLSAFLLLFAFSIQISTVANAATVTFFTDETSFLSQLTSFSVIDFEGIVSDNQVINLGATTIVDGVTFSVSSDQLSITGKIGGVAGTPFDSALLFSQASNGAITITPGSGFTAIGGFFGRINSDNVAATLQIFGTGGSLLLQNIVTESMSFGTPSNFFGFTVLGDDISSLIFNAPSTFQALDNIIVGTVNTVPVPAALPLFGTGLALMGFIGWRKKRKLTEAA